jgi:hypothetical protein
VRVRIDVSYPYKTEDKTTVFITFIQDTEKQIINSKNKNKNTHQS